MAKTAIDLSIFSQLPFFKTATEVKKALECDRMPVWFLLHALLFGGPAETAFT